MDTGPIMMGLSPDQLDHYRREGFVSPLSATSAEEAAENLARLEAVEREEGGQLSFPTSIKPYLLFPWLAELGRRPEVLDPVESVLGPDILLWAGGFFAKNSHDGKVVTWHQDSTYWGLSEPEVVTAWIAFSPSTVESGCMRVIPRSHTVDQLPHVDTHAENNLLSRGQEVAVEVNENEAVDIVLQPGQMSLHHVRLLHGSNANRSSHRRVGMTFRYISTRIRQVVGNEDSAMLVRGTDRYGNFAPEPVPTRDRDPVCVEFHAKMLDYRTRFIYHGAAKGPRGATLGM